MLAAKGKKVIMADFDSQCNLTGLVLDYKSAQDLESLYNEKPEANVKAGLAPAFQSQTKAIEPIECIEVENRENLLLLPGHIGISDYEADLGIAQDMTGPLQALQNLPGSISFLLDTTAEKYEADYILIDTSPNLGPLNKNLVITSDYFLVPTGADFFSIMSIDSLATILPKWKRWSQRVIELGIFNEAEYPFPKSNTKFLGVIIQKYRSRMGGATEAFTKWIEQIETKVNTTLQVELQKNDLLLPDSQYSKIEYPSKKFTLSTIPDFNSLIAESQKANTPVFTLNIPGMVEKKREYEQIYSDLTDKIIKLIEDV